MRVYTTTERSFSRREGCLEKVVFRRLVFHWLFKEYAMNKTPEIVQNPLTNRDTAFTYEERAKLGLTGRLPAAVETLDQQAARL